MVKTSYQYPQFLYALNTGGEAERSPNGSWAEPSTGWEIKAACREEPNGKGNTIQTADGKTLVFSSLIQLPKGTARINEGTEILVTREEVDPSELGKPDFIQKGKISGLVIVTGNCAKYDYGRLHCRLWI